jgi:HPt (histidine-containing phosphotransfer) domain-containing protein
MSRLHPPLSTLHPTSAGAYRERDILSVLESGLPDSFDVFHGVAMSGIHGGVQKFGELDAVVVSPQGHLLLLEVKAGAVNVTAQGISKVYFKPHGNANGNAASPLAAPKDVLRQVHAQRTVMVARLQDQGLGAVQVAQLLVLPDQVVVQGSIAFSRGSIVDAADMQGATALGGLCERIQSHLPAQWLDAAVRSQVMAFLGNQFALSPDVAQHIGQVQRTSLALADGLATWVPRIHSPAGVYTVQATAGSGKTQLALALLQGAAQRRERSTYVCFNRALADHMVRLAPPSAQVLTFHEWCMQHQPSAAASAARVGGGLSQLFADAAAQFVASAGQQAPVLDLLIVDESQDLDAAWVGALLAKVKQTGRLYVLGDSDQAVYERPSFDITESVSITSHDNFRSPRLVVATINALQLCPVPVVARSAFEGTLPNFHPYGSKDKGGLKATEQCMKGLLQDGVQLGHIVLLSFVGRERSHLLAQSHLGAWALRRFTGQFDAAGNAL